MKGWMPVTLSQNLSRRSAGLLFMLLAFAVALPADAISSRPGYAKEIVDLPGLVDRVLPAVVAIEVAKIPTPGPIGRLPFPRGTPFEEYFRPFLREDNRQQQERTTGAGSGFVIDPSGLIVTNFHVVKDADKVRVRFTESDETLDATVKGVDERLDLALLQIEVDEPIASVSWGDSNEIRIGESVFAIGNPLGIGHTVTRGIISAHSRNIGTGPYDSFIQTDAAINLGNSGGPLFNADGNVIGINTSILSRSGDSSGIGFAIPSAQARLAIDQIKVYGEPRRGWLGVTIQDITPDLVEGLGVKDSHGALVSEIAEDGPAEEAGVMVGDIITSFDDDPVPSSSALPWIVAKTPVGKDVTVVITRGEEELELTVTVGRLVEEQVAQRASRQERSNPSKPGQTEELGLVVSDLTPTLAERFAIEQQNDAVVVLRVVDGSEASASGIRPGTLILHIDRKPVENVTEFIRLIDVAKKEKVKRILLLLSFNGRKQFSTLSLEPGS